MPGWNGFRRRHQVKGEEAIAFPKTDSEDEVTDCPISPKNTGKILFHPCCFDDFHVVLNTLRSRFVILTNNVSISDFILTCGESRYSHYVGIV